jgi:hypothetical protein
MPSWLTHLSPWPLVGFLAAWLIGGTFLNKLDELIREVRAHRLEMARLHTDLNAGLLGAIAKHLHAIRERRDRDAA